MVVGLAKFQSRVVMTASLEVKVTAASDPWSAASLARIGPRFYWLVGDRHECSGCFFIQASFSSDLITLIFFLF